MAKYLDSRGLAVDVNTLRREIAVPDWARMRQPYSAPTRNVTPESIAHLLHQADWGDYPERYLAFAEHMEETDLHLGSVLQTRKLGISGLDFVVEAASDRRADRKVADAVRAILTGDGFADTVNDILDGIFKGFSVQEIHWQTDSAEFRPASFTWIDPRWFKFPRENPTFPILLDGQTGVELPAWKFIVHMPKAKSGLPLRGGLARSCAWDWMAKNFTKKDWLAFAEIYGHPFRVGKYPDGTGDADVAKLLDALRGIGIDAVAAFPESMNMELLQSVGSTSPDMYGRLVDYIDQQFSKRVLGHTAVADATPGKLGNSQDATQIRDDILKHDGRQLCVTLKRDLIVPYVRLNWGNEVALPTIRLDYPEIDERELLLNAVKTLVPMGLKVEGAWMRDRFGIPDPDDGAELLTPPAQIVQQQDPALPEPAPAAAANSLHIGCPTCAAHANGDATPHSFGQQLTLAISRQATGQAAAAWQALFAPIQTALDQSEDYEAFNQTLLEIYAELPAAQLVEVMATARALARLAGRFAVQNEVDNA